MKDVQKSTVQTQQAVKLNATIEKRIPKYCNGTFISKVGKSGIVITLVTKTAIQEDGGKMAEENVVIESVFVDTDHAKIVAEKILEVLKSEPKNDE
jgi:hypothetical protein